MGQQAQKTLNDVVKGVGALAGKYRGDDACWRVVVLIDGHDTSTAKNTSQRTNTFLQIPALHYFQLTHNTFDHSEVRQKLPGKMAILVKILKLVPYFGFVK